MKVMKLPFVTEQGPAFSDNLISTLAVHVAAAQLCTDCGERASAKNAEDWLVVLEAKRGRFDDLFLHVHCPECGRKYLANINRTKECALEAGVDEGGSMSRANDCADRKADLEEDGLDDRD